MISAEITERNTQEAESIQSLNFWLGEVKGRSSISVSFYSTGIAINFDFMRPYRSARTLKKLASDLCEIRGVRPYLENAEQVDFRLRPTMDADRVLTSDDDLERFKFALDAALDPDIEPPLAPRAAQT